MPCPAIEPAPDFGRLQTVFAQGVPDRVPFIELFLGEPIMAAIQEPPFSGDADQRARETADLFFRMRCDFVPAALGLAFPYRTLKAADTALFPMAVRAREAAPPALLRAAR